MLTILKARVSPSRNLVPIPSTRDELVQIRKPDFGVSVLGGLKATWIGHATFLVETSAIAGASRGITILLDPVWSNKVGPYGMVGPARFSPTPCSVEDLPDIDAVLISHDHYDHLDSDTVRKIHMRSKGHLRFFCALGMKSCLLGLGVGLKPEEITELDWWDGVQLSVEGVGSVNLVCTPAQHRSGRAPWNFWATLWCSWIVEEITDGAEETQSTDASSSLSEGPQKSSCTGKKLFFAGDTAYCAVTTNEESSHVNASVPPCPAFAEIGDLYGPFDLALLPIGCYSPRSFMSSVHSSPEDSVFTHKDIRSKKSIGMHYGTFRGSLSAHYEDVTEPPKRWKKACEEQGLTWGEDIGLCDIGETVIV